MKTQELLTNTRTFLVSEQDLCIHVIETAHHESVTQNKLLVVYEDAYNKVTGKTDFLSKNELKTKFGILL